MKKISAHREPATRLEAFITDWGVKPGRLAEHAGISRQQLSRLRKGTAEPTRAMMCRLALAASEMRARRVFIVEMFDLTHSEELAYSLLLMAKLILTTVPSPTDPQA